jgi:hypothetical protein
MSARRDDARRDDGREPPVDRTLGELRAAVEALGRRAAAGALADAAIVGRLAALADGLDDLQRRHDATAARLSARLVRLERRVGALERRAGR